MFFRGGINYLEYLLLSHHRKGHGIHSPFVFKLVSEVFRNKTDPDVVLMIENIRKERISDKTKREVLDLGSGSIALKNRIRRVCDIVKYSSVPPKYGTLLFNLASEFGKPGIVEFGTAAGISTMYLAAAAKDSEVITMEGCPALSELAADNFRKAGLTNITQITGPFDDSIGELKRRNIRPGLVFIDGNHRKEPLMRYFSAMADISDKGTVIVIDDIHLSPEMEEAWTEISNSERISFSVDIFRMGMVFFRKGMSPYHYVIRY